MKLPWLLQTLVRLWMSVRSDLQPLGCVLSYGLAEQRECTWTSRSKHLNSVGEQLSLDTERFPGMVAHEEANRHP